MMIEKHYGDCMFTQYVQKLLGKLPVKTIPIIDAERNDTLKPHLQKRAFSAFGCVKSFLPKESALVKRIRTEAAAFLQLLLYEHLNYKNFHKEVSVCRQKGFGTKTFRPP
ncbi:hypothetical protein, partial [Peribacillus simplex]|uniref:hypothetical protein n=1 Tax=Peribacillus simplex TaxID=1478 RepID=UPI003D26B333